MTAALETLLLAFAGEEGLAVPASALLLGAQPHPAFARWPNLTGWQPLKPAATAWDRAGLARVDQAVGRFATVLVLPGKSRNETLAWFALARDHLAPGGRLLAAMPNTAGAARFEKELGKACGPIASLQKHKCRAFHALDDGKWREEVFAEWRALGGRRVIPNTKFVVEPGIFSVDHIDPGSALLAEQLPATLRGDVADLGAGWGFLADAVLRRCPKIARLDLFEADARALACARENLADHERELHFHWHDVCEGLPGSYDAIVMNPPFHTGQATDVDLGRTFLKTANPLFPAHRSGHRLFQRPSPGKQFPSNGQRAAASASMPRTNSMPPMCLLTTPWISSARTRRNPGFSISRSMRRISRCTRPPPTSHAMRRCISNMAGTASASNAWPGKRNSAWCRLA